MGRVPKGFRALEFLAKKSRAPRLHDRKTGARGLHSFTPGLHLSRISIFIWAPSRKKLRAPGSTANIMGLQGSIDTPLSP